VKYRKIESFNTSAQFWAYHEMLLQNDKQHEAGKISEEYFTYWHLYMNPDYIGGGEVYDTNRGDMIPQRHIDAVNGQSTFGRRGNSKGIDKLAVTPDGRYDIMSDKSTKKWTKNAGINQIVGMLALLDHPLTNVRKAILNTNYSGVSAKFAEYEDSRLCVFTLEDFLPAATDGAGIKRDKEMFKWIKSDKRGKRKKVTLNFVPRDPQQTNYIDACYNHAKAELAKVGYAKSYAKAVGAFGKSIVDPVIMGRVQRDFWKVEHTNSPVPVSIHAFHSRITLAENGKRAVQFRRTVGLNEEVIVVSGCEVGDDYEENCANVNRYPRYMNVRNAVKAIKAAMLEGRPVLILTLYHHGDTLARIQKSLRRSYPGFKFWGKCKDETDWPCSNYHSSFAPMLDNRVEAVHTHGSTGTERIGDADKDYGTNNPKIHGPCVFDYGWADAERDGLVKEFNMILQQYSNEELKRIFPQVVNKKGEVEYKRKVNVGGRPIKGEYPTVMQVIKMAALAKTLKRYPSIQRILGFSTYIRQNMIVQENFPHVALAVLGKSKEAREIANLHIEVMNDKQYRGGALSTYEEQIKRAKSKGRYLLLSCRLFNRGYDDSAPPGYKGKWLKHHAAIHFTQKSDVNLCQEIWRVTRLDGSRDKYAYYILPLIYDTDDEPNWERDSYNLLKSIFRSHKRIQDEIIYAINNGSEKERAPSKNKFPLIEQLDPALLKKLATFISLDSDGKEIPNPLAAAHDWLICEYMKLDRPWHSGTKGKVNKRFYENFGELFGNKPYSYVLRWVNNTTSKNDPLRYYKDRNLEIFDDYVQEQADELERKIALAKATLISTTKKAVLPGAGSCGAMNAMAEAIGYDLRRMRLLTYGRFSDYYNNAIENNPYIKKNVNYVVDLFIKHGLECESTDEMVERVWTQLKDENYDLLLVPLSSLKDNYISPQGGKHRAMKQKLLSYCSAKKQADLDAVVELLKHRTSVATKAFAADGTCLVDFSGRQWNLPNKQRSKKTIYWLLEKEAYEKDEDLWEHSYYVS
jgi:hypothetical protein